MRIVITGLPLANSQELFSLLTGIPLATITSKPLETFPGVCDVKDPRIIKLQEMYHPQKTTFTKIEYTLLPDFVLGGPAKSTILKALKNADEICLVVNHDQAKEEIEQLSSELIINDLLLVEKRLGTIAKDQKKKFIEQQEKEKALMGKIKTSLEAAQIPDWSGFSADDQKLLRTYQFLTLKPAFVIINTPEDKINEPAAPSNLPAIRLSIKLEAELLTLSKADRQEFMKEMQLTESAIDRMTRMVYQGLGLISFFTVGEDEVRAWPVAKGATAPEAGRIIHSDIAKGFVRAELIKYDDLITLGSEAKVKEAGKFQLKGRDYIVADGDVLSFRFNV
ncbi:DUF933 domain-containing protein [Candidatus Margulisiibacteriota bacterium]